LSCIWFDSHGDRISRKRPKSWYVPLNLHLPLLFILIFHGQRKVKFPTEFDALDLATDELRAKLIPVSRRLKEIEKERSERRKVRKRTKVAAPTAPAITPSTSTTTATTGTVDVEMGDSRGVMPVDASVPAGAVEEKGKAVAGGELEDESAYRTRELSELEALVAEDVRHDMGCSVTGLYDLVGESRGYTTRVLLI
jgi:ubiquitin carboxyl-terminal hydrolase 14